MKKSTISVFGYLIGLAIFILTVILLYWVIKIEIYSRVFFEVFGG